MQVCKCLSPHSFSVVLLSAAFLIFNRCSHLHTDAAFSTKFQCKRSFEDKKERLKKHWTREKPKEKKNVEGGWWARAAAAAAATQKRAVRREMFESILKINSIKYSILKRKKLLMGNLCQIKQTGFFSSLFLIILLFNQARWNWIVFHYSLVFCVIW